MCYEVWKNKVDNYLLPYLKVMIVQNTFLSKIQLLFTYQALCNNKSI